MAEEKRRGRAGARRNRRKACSFCIDKVEKIDYKMQQTSQVYDRPWQNFA